MGETTRQLRPYQVRLVTDVCRTSDDVLVEQPTGSGKTVQIVTLVAMQLGQRFTHAVISAPQEQIEEGFVQRDYQTIAFPVCPGVAVPPILAPAALIKGARESKLGSVKRVIHYLRQPGPLDHAFACTHAALNRLTPDDLPADLSGKALFIDEAHHASADGLTQIVTLWRERRGQLFFFTATPYRGDGRPVRLEGMRAYRRSLAEHMAEGFAPGRLESEIVALGQPGDAITAGQFTGEEAPPSSYFDGLVAAICRRWLEDGKPKSIVRVPPMKGGRSGELVSRLMHALASQGGRVLDATGTGAADKQRFLTGLEAEKSRTYATSEFDVMVGIQRVLEGTDWPVCSAVYCVGMPGSLNTVVQFLGRAMRLKGEDYPAEQRDRARLVFFVPCGGGTALAELSLDHSRHALLTCCFLADHEVGQEWIVLREVRRGIEAALGSRAESRAAADAENEADEALDQEIRAEVELAMADAREQIISRGEEPTVGEVVEWAAKTRPDLPEAAIQRIATEILAGQPGSVGAASREVLHQEVAKRLRIDPMIKKAMAEAFAVVLEEFRDVTLKDSAVLESVGRQVHGVTGRQMRHFAHRLRDAAPRPLTEKQILAWADSYNERTDKWPNRSSGPIADTPGEQWSAIDAALVAGFRGLPGRSSLAKLLEEKRGVRNQQNLPPLTEGQILAWADAHHADTAAWPNLNSGEITLAPGETWARIQDALSQGFRSLPGGSSLARLLEEHRGVRNNLNLPALTREQILNWADAHHERTGDWPIVKSGTLADAPQETWSGLNAALERGLRGLPGGSSLARLLTDARGVRNNFSVPDLNEEVLVRWIKAHREETGEWPNHLSGHVKDAPGENWRNIDQALRAGARGFPGGSSLAKFREANFGVRNPSNLPQLTVERITEWIRDYHEQTGQWPRQKSGVIRNGGGETWSSVDKALRAGKRGLKVSSLAIFLKEHFGVRNHLNPLTFSENDIAEWVREYRKRTGDWPKASSGPVRDIRGLNWSKINYALIRGSCSLPGGSSLAKFLHEFFGVRNEKDLARFSDSELARWAQHFFDQTGDWPKRDSGPIQEAPAETWKAVDSALIHGGRGLPGGSSLPKFLEEYFGVRNKQNLPRLTEEWIHDRAAYHHEQTGKWPTENFGQLLDAPEETWKAIQVALYQGRRGLPGGSTLPRFLNQHFGVPIRG